MNLFDSLVVTPELKDAMSRMQLSLRQREDADLAIAANARSIEAANAATPELESIATRLQAEAIKCEALASASVVSKADVGKAVKTADKAHLDLTEKKRELERATAARGVLADMARDADAVIAQDKAAFISALAAYREQPLIALKDDLLAACDGRASLRDVLAAARAVDVEFPGGLCTPLLDNLKIISPCGYRISHDEIGRARVSGTDLLADEAVPATLPEEAALLLREIDAIVDALKRHKPFRMPKLTTPATAPAAPRSAQEQRRYDEAAEHIRRSEEEYDQREARRNQSAKGHSWSVSGPLNNPGRYEPHTATNGNAAASDLDGSISDEWNRIGVGDGDGGHSSS